MSVRRPCKSSQTCLPQAGLWHVVYGTLRWGGAPGFGTQAPSQEGAQSISSPSHFPCTPPRAGTGCMASLAAPCAHDPHWLRVGTCRRAAMDYDGAARTIAGGDGVTKTHRTTCRPTRATLMRSFSGFRPTRLARNMSGARAGQMQGEQWCWETKDRTNQTEQTNQYIYTAKSGFQPPTTKARAASSCASVRIGLVSSRALCFLPRVVGWLHCAARVVR